MSLVSTAVQAAETGGRVLVELYDLAREIGHKDERANLVTDADRKSEAAITDVIRARFPEHAILAEEGTSATGAGHRWVVDPLDGTVNYAHRIPHWCVSVAVEDDEGPVVGVVHDPLRGETFVASRGGGARLGAHPLTVRDTTELRDAVLATGFAYDPALRRQNLANLGRIAVGVRGVRRMGSAALDLAYVAAGRLDGFWELGLSRWDIAAGVLLVTEAGGIVTAFDAARSPLDTGELVAGNRAIHDALREALLG